MTPPFGTSATRQEAANAPSLPAGEFDMSHLHGETGSTYFLASAEGTGHRDAIAGTLPDLARLSLGECNNTTGFAPAPAAPDSTLAGTHIYITVNVYQGASVTINTAPMDNARQGIQAQPAASWLAFTNPSHCVVVAAAAPPLATNNPLIGRQTPAVTVAGAAAAMVPVPPATAPVSGHAVTPDNGDNLGK